MMPSLLFKAASTEFRDTSADSPKSPTSPIALRRQSKLVVSTSNASKFRRAATMGMVPLDVAAKRRTVAANESISEALRPGPSNNVALLRAAFKAARTAFSRQINDEIRSDLRQTLKQAFLAVLRGVHATLFLQDLMRVWTDSVKARKPMTPSKVGQRASAVVLYLGKRESLQEQSGYQARRSKNLLARASRRESVFEPSTHDSKRHSNDGSGQPPQPQPPEPIQEPPAFGVQTLIRRMSVVPSIQRLSKQWGSSQDHVTPTCDEADEDAYFAKASARDFGKTDLRDFPIARSRSSSSSSSSSFASKAPDPTPTLTQLEKEETDEATRTAEVDVEVAQKNQMFADGRRMSFNRVYPELRERSPSLSSSSRSSSSSSSSSRSHSGEACENGAERQKFTNKYVDAENAKALEKLRMLKEKQQLRQIVTVQPRKYVIADYCTFRIWAVEALPGYDFVIEDTHGSTRQLCSDSAGNTFSKDSKSVGLSSESDKLSSSQTLRRSMPRTARGSSDIGSNNLSPDCRASPHLGGVQEDVCTTSVNCPLKKEFIPGGRPSPRLPNARSVWMDKHASQKPRLLHCIQERSDIEVAGLRVGDRRSVRIFRSTGMSSLPGVMARKEAALKTSLYQNYQRDIDSKLPALRRPVQPYYVDQDTSPRTKASSDMREEDKLPPIQRSDIREQRAGRHSTRRHEEKNAARSTTFLAARFQAEVARVVLQTTPRRAFDLHESELW